MPRIKRQTTINDHFSPSNKYSIRANSSSQTTGIGSRNARPTRGKPAYRDESDSEGSDGLANIRFTQRSDDGQSEPGSSQRVKRAESKRVKLNDTETTRESRSGRKQSERKDRSDRSGRRRDDMGDAHVDQSDDSDATGDEVIVAQPSEFVSQRKARVTLASATAKRSEARTSPIPPSSRADRSLRGKQNPQTVPAQLSRRQPTPGLIPYVEIPLRRAVRQAGEPLPIQPLEPDPRPLLNRAITPAEDLSIIESEILAVSTSPKQAPPSPSSDLRSKSKAQSRAPIQEGAVTNAIAPVIDLRSDSDDADAPLPKQPPAQKRKQRAEDSNRRSTAQASTRQEVEVAPSARRLPRGEASNNVRSKRSARPVDKPRSTQRKTASEDSDQDEDNEADDIELDEPERFRTATRLRGRTENEFQRKLRKLKEKRLGRQDSTTEEDADEVEEDDDDESDEEDSEENFIEEDGGKAGDVMLPHQFSLDSAQSPEFKFKVVFHYLVMLNVQGPGILPLQGDAQDYFRPQLEYLRRMMVGYRDSRVRSQIWRADLVKALQTYPSFVEQYLEVSHFGCDACHISGRISSFEITLEGDPYDHETHRVEDTDSEEERQREKRAKRRAKKQKRRRSPDVQSISSDESDDSQESSARKYYMGRFCKARAQVYHRMSHWEDDLYCRIRDYYKELLRALRKPVPSDSEMSSSENDPDELEDERVRRREARDIKRAATAKRIAKLRASNLPNHKDVDAITKWMDVEMGYQAKEFRWLNAIITRSERLEYDKKTDD